MEELALAHWPLIVVALALGVTGEVMKKLVIPKENPTVLLGWRGVFRTTLPLHAPIVGLLVGLIPGMPCPEDLGTWPITPMLYYMAGGILSSYGFAALKHFFKERLGSDAPV